jgi:hypothetical protein
MRITLITKLGTQFTGTLTRLTVSRVEWTSDAGKAYGMPVSHLGRITNISATVADMPLGELPPVYAKADLSWGLSAAGWIDIDDAAIGAQPVYYSDLETVTVGWY